MVKEKNEDLEKLISKGKILLEGAEAVVHTLIPIEGQRFYYKKTKNLLLSTVGVTAYQFGFYLQLTAYLLSDM